MNKKTMNFYSYKLLGLLSLTLLSQPASADLFKCNACPAGYKCDGISQTICPAGTYSQAGAASCTSCSAGTYSNGSGQSSCKSCPAGQYQNASGQTSCKPCTGDTYSNAGASSCSTCASDSIVNSSHTGCDKGKNCSYRFSPDCSSVRYTNVDISKNGVRASCSEHWDVDSCSASCSIMIEHGDSIDWHICDNGTMKYYR